MGLGDLLERALAGVGVTPEQVERWLGRPCGCRERKEKLNNLSQWLARRISGRDNGRKEIQDIIDSVD